MFLPLWFLPLDNVHRPVAVPGGKSRDATLMNWTRCPRADALSSLAVATVAACTYAAVRSLHCGIFDRANAMTADTVAKRFSLSRQQLIQIGRACAQSIQKLIVCASKLWNRELSHVPMSDIASNSPAKLFFLFAQRRDRVVHKAFHKVWC